MRITDINAFAEWAVLVAVYAVNIYSLLTSNRYRVSKRRASLVIVAIAAVLFPLLRLQSLPWPLPPLYHLCHYALLLTIVKGSAAALGYFYSMICAFTMFIRIVASFAVEPFTGYGTEAYSIAWSALTLVLMAGYVLAVRRIGIRWRDALDGKINTSVMALFALIAMVCWQTLYAAYIVPGAFSPVVPLRREIGFLALPFALTGLILAMSFSYLTAQRRAADLLELRLAQAALSSGHSHYEKLAQLSEAVRTLRHDSRHHLSALASLIAAGDIDQAQRYIGVVQQQSESAELRQYCQSPVINALLNAHAARCLGEDIAFSCEIALTATETQAEYELCIIIGNLLENALEGCKTTPDGARRYIDLVLRPHGDQFGVMVENSFSGKVREDERGLLSTKPASTGDTGIGIQSIRAIAKRHGGEYYPNWSDTVFTAYVVLSRTP